MKFTALLRALLVVAMLLPALHIHMDADTVEAQSSCAVCLHAVDDDYIVDKTPVAQSEYQRPQTLESSIGFSTTTPIQTRARAPPARLFSLA